MDNQALKSLFDKVDAKFDIGTFEEFKGKMQTTEQRKKFFDKVSEKFNIGTYSEFEKRLAGTGCNAGGVKNKNGKCVFPCLKRIKQYLVPGTTGQYKMGGDIYRFTSDGKYEILGKKTSTGTGTWACNTNGFIELNGVKSSLVNQFEWRIAPTEEEVKNGKKILKFGMKGDFVKKVQDQLKVRGFDPKGTDGKFGKNTKSALISYQKEMGLKPDGILGMNTYSKLFFEAPSQEKINIEPKGMDTEIDVTTNVQPQSPIPSIKESLKKNLKTTLVEKTKENENLIVETNIIKNRFALISEGQTFESEESKIDLIESVFVETNYLSIQGYNSELINEGLFSFIGSILGGGVGSTPQVVGEYIAKWLTRKLGVPQGSYIEGVIVSLVTSMNISDYDKIFTDCRFLTNKLSDALIEGYLFQMQSQKGLESGVSGFLLSAIRNSIMEYFAEDKDGLIQKLEDKIAEFLCPAISKISGKVQDKADELKDKALA
jgi:hypothetical protein